MQNFVLTAQSSSPPPVNARCLCDNFRRKFMSDHKVFCAKLKQELPGLPEPPFDSELGKKIYDNVSQQAWGQWMEHCKMLLNEYRLNPARKQDQEVIVQQMEQFFFGEGAARPAEYVPPAH
jgi:Fe-S cluster biosynthesis and repair protein YggX